MANPDPLGLGPDWSETSPAPRATRAQGAKSSQGQHDHGHDDGYRYDEPPFEDEYFDGGYFDEGYFDEGAFTGGASDEGPFDEPPSRGASVGAPTVQTPAAVRRPAQVRDIEIGESGNDTSLRVLRTLRQVIAAQHGREAGMVISTVRRVRANRSVLERIPAAQLSVFEGIFEVLEFEAAGIDGVGVIDFDALSHAENYRKSVRQEFASLRNLARDGIITNPAGVWDALCEQVQAEECKLGAQRLIGAIDAKANAEEKQRLFRALKAPTARRSVQNNTWAKSAEAWLDDAAAAATGAPTMTLSSGFPSLDMACTTAGDPLGLIRPGEFWIAGAGTGHGKSAWTRRVIVSMLMDLVEGWGYRYAKAILAFTEEEAEDVARAAMVGRGQPYHHLASNLILAKVGQSRERVIKSVYDVVIDAHRQSLDTNLPISEFLPYLYVLDYVQGIHEDGENPDGEAIAKTADLLMRGIAAWDPEMMAMISGIDFREYAGMDWPSDMERHRVAVITTSQLRKEGTDVYFRTGKSSPSDFAVIDESGRVCWEPRENDYAIPDRSDLRGSGVLLNHATGLIFLHRSQPTTPQVKDPVTGQTIRLADTRARFIVAKARKSVSMPYVPMRFDTNPEGFRGQFYDDLAHEHGVKTGRLTVTDAYQREGDPMLPTRPKRGAFRGVRY